MIPLKHTASVLGVVGGVPPVEPPIDPGPLPPASPYVLDYYVFSPTPGASVSARTTDMPASSTADYYFIDGLTDLCPYDLTTMGALGNAIAADPTKGRYVWFISCDHPADGSGQEGGWHYDGTHTYAGFSNDPTIPPEPSTLRAIYSGERTAIPGMTGFMSRQFQARLTYNPDDPTTPFWVYGEGMAQGTSGGDPPVNSLNMLLFKAANFDAQMTPVAVSHKCTGGFGLVGYQFIYRIATGNWVSFGGGRQDRNWGDICKWTSTDGISFTPVSQVDAGMVKYALGGNGIPCQSYPAQGWQTMVNLGKRFQIGGVWYMAGKEDRRSGSWSSTATYAINERCSAAGPTYGSTSTANATWHTYRSIGSANTNHDPTTTTGFWEDLGILGQYVALIPVDFTTGDVNFTGTPPFIRVSGKYDGIFPSSSYIQYVDNYNEDGICFFYATCGMFGDVGMPSSGRNMLPENGGGLNEQWVDIYAYVFDPALAATSAPAGVKASCEDGLVTLSWKDIPVGRTYRVRSGTVAGTYNTLLGDITGVSLQDGPPPNAMRYYKVTSMSGLTEQKSRYVSVYVS